jgi:hypothetical protein
MSEYTVRGRGRVLRALRDNQGGTHRKIEI